ncbi:hypothetical protein C0416_03080 [bacterium]|nr:hypothetical protein [bacterium]
MILASTFFVTACSLFGGDDDNVVFESNVQEKRIGTLKSLGGMSVGEGTHILELKDKSTMRLKSSKINLDDEKYISKMVEVRGPVAKTSDEKELMDVQSIDLYEDEDDQNAIEGVETDYTNAKLGIFLTYLDSWKITEEETRIIFTAPEVNTDEANNLDEATASEPSSTTKPNEELKQDVVIIERIPNPQKKTLESFLQLPADSSKLMSLGYTQTLVGADRLDGLKKESSDRYEIDIWLTRAEYVYQFSFIGSEHADVAKNRNTFFSMISSFKFVGILEEDTDEENTQEEEQDSVEENTSEEADSANNQVEEDSPTVKDTPKVDSAPVTETKTTTSSSDSTYSLIAQYVGKEINTLAPESAETGSWKTYSFEFVDPNYVYAYYTDGTNDRRILLSYEHDGTSFDTNIEAYFQPGETTSWTRVSGENPVENKEKTVVEVTAGGTTQSAVVKEGYSYFESLPYDFLAQYPSGWYFSGASGGDGTLHHYGFSNQPVENGNELVSIDIVKGSIPAGSSISVGENTGVKVYENGEVAVYIARADGTLYKIHGGSGYETSVIDIAASIKAN